MIADLTQGEALTSALNYLRYDALTIGNYEPDFGMSVLRERIEQVDLVDGTATVPSGAVEVIGKQSKGFAYFRP